MDEKENKKKIMKIRLARKDRKKPYSFRKTGFRTKYFVLGESSGYPSADYISDRNKFNESLIVMEDEERGSSGFGLGKH